jgi:uncharacterized DUF497 family protein
MALLPEFFEGLTGFEWDAGNADKVLERHGVSPAECEQVFVNRPVLVTGDARHSTREVRYYAFGFTDQARHLTIVFTLRGRCVRVVSARPMSRRERSIYDDAKSSQADAEADPDLPV